MNTSKLDEILANNPLILNPLFDQPYEVDDVDDSDYPELKAQFTALISTEIAKGKIEVLDKIKSKQKELGMWSNFKDVIDAELVTLKADTESNKEGVEVNES